MLPFGDSATTLCPAVNAVEVTSCVILLIQVLNSNVGASSIRRPRSEPLQSCDANRATEGHDNLSILGRFLRFTGEA
jgi:hypothetical protein